MTLPLTKAQQGPSLLARAIESDCIYFEMGAQIRPLEGATMAWMPGLTGSPAAAVIQRVDPAAITVRGSWIANTEGAMAGVGAGLCRIYLDEPHCRAEQLLRSAGYVAREELVFVDSVQDPAIDLTLRPIVTDADWADKLRFHQTADDTPDGHANRAGDWVELERRKSRAGLEAFLAELDGEVVGAVGAIWFDEFVRTKNLVVHPACRRRGIGRAIIGSIAALALQRGISGQCALAVRGEYGELLYRGLGMNMIGKLVEWSRPIAGRAQ